MSDYFFSMRPAYPWSVEPIGLPLLGVVAVVLVLLTVWSYLGHPNASRRRIFVVVTLRLLALGVALLTALRPSIGVQENPKIPSVLVIGVDLSESMTTKDEVNNQARVDAVRKVMEKCQPIFDELKTEQSVDVQIYKFSTPDFSEGTSKFNLTDAADGKRSDYGTFLHRTFERWQSERFLRGCLIVGDGVDNGEKYSAIAEAARWGHKCPVTTFTVGFDTGPSGTDISVTGIDCDPSPVPIKNDVRVTANVNAYGFVGARVVARLFIDGKLVATEEFTLDKEKDNKLAINTKAPETKGEVKVKVVVGQLKDDQLVPLRGELNGENNQSETYLTVTKDGLRLLIIDRLRWEETRLRDALRSEKRFDINEVIRQTDGAVTAAEEEFLDLDTQAYDVIVIGNITPNQLTFNRAGKTIFVLDKIKEAVLKKGMGVIFLGGEHSFRGMPADLLPVTVPENPAQAIIEKLDGPGGRPVELFQTVPTDEGLAKMMKLARDPKQSLTLWEELNTTNRQRAPAKITGYNKMTTKPGATVYAWTTPQREAVPAGTAKPDKGADPLLVGWQVGDGARGRVLAFAAYDTYLWEKLGQPKTRQGSEIHSRFWKQVLLWLAHQEDEEGEAYVRPAYRQLKVNGEQTLRLGVKLPGGGDDPNAEFTVKIVPLPEGKIEPDAAEIDKAKPETVIRDKDGAKVLYRPRAKGEYFVVMTSPKKGPDGKPIQGPDGKPVLLRATAKFIAVPDISDEMLKVNADHEFMTRLSVPNSGKALRLEDLPSFLKELKEQKDTGMKPKPKFYPDWRRNHSGGFLPAWLALFVVLLGGEWALRRLWGLV